MIQRYMKLRISGNGRRNKMELHTDLLRAVNDGIYKPTLLMYSTNTSWLTAYEILGSLLHNKFVTVKEVSGKKRTKTQWFITEKGREYLKLIDQVDALIE